MGEEPFPVEYVIIVAKLPLPYPRKTPILSESQLATTISNRLSLLKSPEATAVGPENFPVEYIL